MYEATELDTLDDSGVSADLVRAYLNGIGRRKLLTAAQEVELAKRIEAGLYAQHRLDHEEIDDPELRTDLAVVAAEGRAAKEHLLEANLRLVVSTPSATPVGDAFLDLIQEGNVTDPAEKLTTPWLQVLHLRHLVDRQAITRAMADQAALSASRCTWSSRSTDGP